MKDVEHLFPDIVVYGAQHIQLGARVSFNNFCHLTASEEATISIGDDVLCGPFVLMNTGDHGFRSKDLKIRDQPVERARIVIGNDVWIGARVTILRGAIIPDGCIIGACSLVTLHCNLKPYAVYVGNPLRQIGERT
jgi:acetyltransferase-like isoleucine patch superfamily enzyme